MRDNLRALRQLLACALATSMEADVPAHAPLDAATRRFFYAAALWLLVFFAGCGNLPEPGAVVCTADQDCNVGETCKEGQCVGDHDFLCSTAADCEKGLADKKWKPLSTGTCWQPTCDGSTRLCVMQARPDTFDCSSGDGADPHHCTVGRCDGKGACKHDAEIKADQCFIGEPGKQICYANTTLNPANPCQACSAPDDPRAWSDKKPGSKCSKAGLAACQTAACSDKGKCEATTQIEAGQCYVDDDNPGATAGEKICVPEGQSKQGSGGCVVCDSSSAANQTKWTQKKANASCDGGKKCQVGLCSAQGKCLTDKVAVGWCRIGGVCKQKGENDGDNVCLVCDPSGAGQDKWTKVAAKTTCKEDSHKCTTDACDGSGTCVHTPDDMACSGDPGACKKNVCDPKDGCKTTALPNGATCTTDSAACTSQTCADGKCGAGKPDDSACDDGIPCTDDSCDPKAGCKHTPSTKAGTCDDGNACTTDTCDPAGSAGTPGTGKNKGCLHKAKTGGACLDDGKSCTAHTCKAGVCDVAVSAGSCFIDNACHLAKAATASGCQVCDPGKSSDTWSPLAKGAACGPDKLSCTVDACDGKGKCTHDEVASTSCLISGACVAKGTKSGKGCTSCVPLASQSAWTPLTKGTKCDDDGTTCTEDLCDGKGTCTHDKVLATHCLISGTCIKAGSKSGSGCLSCEPSKHQGKWLPVAKGAACDSDKVTCTKDVCDGGGTCKHETQDALCDDKLGCTWDACAPSNTLANKSSGCANVDKCPYGHGCDAKKNACLSTKPVVVASKDAANPEPTNPAVVRHVLDSKLGLSRTWVVFQSQACATASSGKWQISQGAELRAAVLDDQVAPVGKKVKPPVVSFKAHLAGGSKAGVCQGFPSVAADPQSSTQAWVHWLEADTKKLDKGGCLTGAGQGGVMRFALLDTSKATSGQVWAKASGSVCLKSAPNFPLFLTPAFAPIDGAAGSVSSVAKRSFMSARPNGFGLNSAPLSQLVGLGTPTSMKWSTVNPSGAFSQVRPTIVDTGAASQRYWLLAMSKDGSRRRLEATPFDKSGKKGSTETWIDSQSGAGKTVLAGVSSICAISSTAIKGGGVAFTIATVAGTNHRIHYGTRRSGKTVVKQLFSANVFSSDCRIGYSNTTSTLRADGTVAISLLASAGAGQTGEIHTAAASAAKPIIAKLTGVSARDTDSLGGAPLANRGITATARPAGGAVTIGYESKDGTNLSINVVTVAP